MNGVLAIAMPINAATNRILPKSKEPTRIIVHESCIGKFFTSKLFRTLEKGIETETSARKYIQSIQCTQKRVITTIERDPPVAQELGMTSGNAELMIEKHLFMHGELLIPAMTKDSKQFRWKPSRDGATQPTKLEALGRPITQPAGMAQDFRAVLPVIDEPSMQAFTAAAMKLVDEEIAMISTRTVESALHHVLQHTKRMLDIAVPDVDRMEEDGAAARAARS